MFFLQIYPVVTTNRQRSEVPKYRNILCFNILCLSKTITIMIRVTKFSRKEISEMQTEISYVYENQQMTHSSVERKMSLC